MSRNSVGAVTSAAYESRLKYQLLCQVSSLTTGTLYACTGNRFIVAGATTYSPVGDFGGAEKVQEDSDVFPRAVKLWFSAVNTVGIIESVLNETLFGNEVRLFRAMMHVVSGTLVGTPQLLFKGNIDTVDMKYGDPDRGNFFELMCESKLRYSGRTRYFNKATLQVTLGHSGDTFFDTTNQVPLTSVPWGGRTINLGFPGGAPTDPTNPAFPWPAPGIG